jgi:hypothetical protein
MALCLAVVGLWLSGLAGPAAVGPILPLVVLLFHVPVLLTFAVSFLLCLWRLSEEDPSRLVYAGPEVEALVPVYGESAVLHRPIEALADSAYGDLTVRSSPNRTTARRSTALPNWPTGTSGTS